MADVVPQASAVPEALMAALLDLDDPVACLGLAEPPEPSRNTGGCRTVATPRAAFTSPS
jgi:hypothetical protein